ncbi:MAG: hypothetical protein RRC07_02285 [Anaerolineae bacterium]|nr:hypothetical protein [Anaerolineae bacterium]
MFPLCVVFFGSERLPPWTLKAAASLPATAAADLIRLSFGNVSHPAQLWPRLAAILLAVLVVLAVTAWRLRTWER